MQTTEQDIINATKSWIFDVVIGKNFCPFAKKEWLNDTIAYGICEAGSNKYISQQVLQEIRRLDQNNQIETSLVIVPNSLTCFYDYLDCLGLIENLLSKHGYDGVFQVASFHPQYVFHGSQQDDAENFTNRSPYPCFHILREQSISKAVEKFPNVDDIPIANAQTAKTLGADHFAKLLNGYLNNT